MTYTDEQINRVAAAIGRERVRGSIVSALAHGVWVEPNDRDLAIAALAAIEPPEPLEDVLNDGEAWCIHICNTGPKEAPIWDVTAQYDGWEHWTTANRLTDAIRAAVAAAKEQS
jgi:hypothetical protein